jgi:Clp amino terminal domain, pathogenicity island component
MFNLDQAIIEWRQQMAAGGIKSREVLAELESHLRDDVEQQMRDGVAADQAFRDAVQRIGAAEIVRGEFAKVSAPPAPFSMKLLRVCCAGMAVFIVLVETWTLLLFEMTPAERILGMMFVWLLAGYVGALPYLNRRLFPGVRGVALRNVLGAVCNYGGVLWISLALLSALNVIRLPDGLLFNLVGWSLLGAGTATVFVLAFGTDWDRLGLWSPAVMQCFEVASEEAIRFHHDFVGTEHVLLGLLDSDAGIVSKALGKMGVSRETVRAEIEKIVGSGPQLQSSTGHAPVCTPRANKALRLAMKEARILRRERVEAEHIFLGLLLEGSGVAARVLQGLGVSPDDARREILKELHLA